MAGLASRVACCIAALGCGAVLTLGSGAAAAHPFELEQKLVASDPASAANLGLAVAIDGGTLVVASRTSPGLPGCTGSGCDAVYVFDRTPGGKWLETTKLIPSGAVTGYPSQVALDGDRAVVSAADFVEPGSLHIFERDAGGPDAWGEVAHLVPPTGPPDITFGSSVALDGETLAAIGTEDGVGTVAIFARNQGGPGAWGLGPGEDTHRSRGDCAARGRAGGR